MMTSKLHFYLSFGYIIHNFHNLMLFSVSPLDDFKPASVDTGRESHVEEAGSQVTVTVPHVEVNCCCDCVTY